MAAADGCLLRRQGGYAIGLECGVGALCDGGWCTAWQTLKQIVPRNNGRGRTLLADTGTPNLFTYPRAIHIFARCLHLSRSTHGKQGGGGE
eukprot:48831-Chlamydomonas_euryale.AAC.1